MQRVNFNQSVRRRFEKMKVCLTENKKINEPYVEITYSFFNQQIQKLVDFIKVEDIQLQVQKENQIHFIQSVEIYYIESVDNLTFMYTKKDVFESKEKLYALNKKLNKHSFVQINRSTLLNMDYLEYVEPLPNYRLEAYLKNGDRLVISRHYMKDVKQYLNIE